MWYLLKPSIEEDSLTSFQRMLFAKSLAYTQPTTAVKHYLSVLELQLIGAMAGHHFIKILDQKLKPQSLGAYSKDNLQALFLLVVGTILDVGYSEPIQNTLKVAPGHQTSFKNMQNRLCRILAHYMVFMGSKLDLGIACHLEQLIVEGAHLR